MLTKSVKSAFILSAITVVSFSAMSALVTILIPYLLSGNIRVVIERPENLRTPEAWAVLVGLIAVLLLILTGIGAFWLYRFFGERYYGPRGALRWALFGAIFALLLRLPDWLLPDSMNLLGYILDILDLFVAFFLARWLVPLERNAKP